LPLVVISRFGISCKNFVPAVFVMLVLPYILEYLHSLTLPHLLSSTLLIIFPNKWYQSQKEKKNNNCFGFVFTQMAQRNIPFPAFPFQSWPTLTSNSQKCWSSREVHKASVGWAVNRGLVASVGLF